MCVCVCVCVCVFFFCFVFFVCVCVQNRAHVHTSSFGTAGHRDHFFLAKCLVKTCLLAFVLRYVVRIQTQSPYRPGANLQQIINKWNGDLYIRV